MIKWNRLLNPDRVLVGIRSTRRFDAIRELAALIQGDDAVGDHKRFLADLIRSEKQGSTGIGHGVAIPHVHEDYIHSQILAVGVSDEGIDFGGLDDTPVRIMVLFASPQKHQKQHMELLAALSRLLQTADVRERLIEVTDAAEVVEVFSNAAQPV
jgi:PTS system nitrogen regulatory IIA component